MQDLLDHFALADDDFGQFGFDAGAGRRRAVRRRRGPR